MGTEVHITKRAEKSLKTVPRQIASGFFTWKREVQLHGIEDVRKIPGYYDEPLKGKLKGYARSIRLGRGYRAYYRMLGETMKFLLVEEVNKHAYEKIERLFGL